MLEGKETAEKYFKIFDGLRRAKIQITAFANNKTIREVRKTSRMN